MTMVPRSSILLQTDSEPRPHRLACPGSGGPGIMITECPTGPPLPGPGSDGP